VKLSRSGRVAGVALVGALALAACGSNSTGTPAASGSASAGSSGSSAGAAATGTLNGEGSTAQKNAIDQVITDFQTANSGATVNYNATGSGAGIKQFTGGQVDFGGSDAALNATPVGGATSEVDAAKTRCGGNDAWDLPMVAGPIAVSYNLPGVSTLVLTPSLAAKIFSGAIKTWNDPAIKAANPSAALPSTPIKVFFRSDASGTTQNFETYLNTAAAADWPSKPSKTWAGKVGEGKTGSAGVSASVKSTVGAVAYVEWSYATLNKLGIASIDNGAGPVALTAATASAAVAAATPAGTGNDLRLKIDYVTKAPGTYPIILITYEIVCSKGLAADKTALLKSFLTFFSSPAEQSKLISIGSAPLPAAVQAKVAAAVSAIS